MEYKGLDLEHSIYKIDSLPFVDRIFYRNYDEEYFVNLLQQGPLYLINFDEKNYLCQVKDNKESIVIEGFSDNCGEVQLLINLGFGSILDEVSLKDLVQFYFPV